MAVAKDSALPGGRMSLLCGVDIGGTFTDSCLVGEDGSVSTGKASTTPGELGRGVLDSLAAAAQQAGLGLEEALARVDGIVHGTTVATNAILERGGARVGLITTVGFGDTIFVQRGYGKVAGLPPSVITHLSVLRKAEPPVAREMVAEIVERIDWKGAVVVPLDEEGARASIRRLAEAGAEALAVCLLWSFRNPSHELRVKELAAEVAPDLYVTVSSEVVPKWGEYERTVATVLNAYLGPKVAGYVAGLEREVADRGVRAPLRILQCAGGMVSAETAAARPILTLQSGPVGGVIGAGLLAAEAGWRDVIVADMGGTSFDVGLLVDGLPVTTESTVVDQLEFFVPRVDIRSIGTGGGSIVWVDPGSGTLKVGPRSAGAEPGPVSYGRGGAEPTITDANVVLGRINPGRFLGGELRLDRAAAVSALERVGDEVGMSAEEAAAAAVVISEFQMAELIHQLTVETGYDPRDFVVLACGGAGPTHAGGFAGALGARRVIVPLAGVSAAWSAYGAARADVVHRLERVEVTAAPFDPGAIAERLAELEAAGHEQLERDGIAPAAQRLRRLADLRYRAQINEVEVDVPNGSVSEESLAELVARFERKYERLYGKGAGFAAAGVELVALRIEARGLRASAAPPAAPRGKGSHPEGEREVFFYGLGRLRTAVYDGLALGAGDELVGPAIVELPHTTVVVNPEQHLRVEEKGSLVLELGSS